MQLWLGGQQVARYRVARGYYKDEAVVPANDSE